MPKWTVEQLIKKLQEFPDDSKVYITETNDERSNSFSIETAWFSQDAIEIIVH